MHGCRSYVSIAPYYKIFNYRKFPSTPGRIIVELYHIANPDVLLVGSSGAVDFS